MSLPEHRRGEPLAPVLRRATAADTDAIVALWEAAGMRYDSGDARAFLEAARRHDPDLVLVAEVGERPVGVLLATCDGTRGWLKRLAVHPAHRGRGLGRLLVAEGERRLAARGVPQINLHVLEPDALAQRFWERLGYQAQPAVTLRSKRL